MAYRRGLSMLAFVLLVNSAQAEDATLFTQLQALSPAPIAEPSTASAPYDLRKPTNSMDAEGLFWRDKIYTILLQHRRHHSGDPDYLLHDIAAMADYFARYSAVRELFAALEGKPWHWQHSRDKAESRVEGTRLQVRAIGVLFDSRAGAQFQFREACTDKIPYCFAAPADVFLHELLHVFAILTNPQAFIAQGGMGEHLYPHAHEQQTIAAERRLYAAMSRQDNVPRPARASHTGRRTSTHCVTCLR